MGPVIAGRLYGAHRTAMTFRVSRPDGNVDQGDAALVRLPVDECETQNTNEVIQQAIPFGRAVPGERTTPGIRPDGPGLGDGCTGKLLSCQGMEAS